MCPVKKGITELRVGAVRRLGIHVEESGIKGLLKLVAKLLSLIHKNKLTTHINSLTTTSRQAYQIIHLVHHQYSQYIRI